MVRLSQVEQKDAPSLIFDFDGTLANTLPILIEIAEQWPAVNIHLTVELVEELRGMPAQQVLKRLGIPLRKLPALMTYGRKEFISRLGNAKPFVGTEKMIQKLAQNNNLYIMSSNSDENINKFLGKYNLSQYFLAVYGNASVFGKTKMLKKIIKREGLSKEHCTYIGDETRDIEAAHKIGIKVASVTWGYNNKQILSTFSPDYLLSKPSDLITTFS